MQSSQDQHGAQLMAVGLPCLQANNVVVRTWGEKREEADLYSHVDLIEMLDIVDLENGTTVAGASSFRLLPSPSPAPSPFPYGLQHTFL